MTSIYVITTNEYRNTSRYKVGIHTGDREQLLTRYRTPLINPLLLLFKETSNAKIIEDELKITHNDYRIYNDKGNRSEWYYIELNYLISKINEIDNRLSNTNAIITLNSGNIPDVNSYTYHQNRFLDPLFRKYFLLSVCNFNKDKYDILNHVGNYIANNDMHYKFEFNKAGIHMSSKYFDNEIDGIGYRYYFNIIINLNMGDDYINVLQNVRKINDNISKLIRKENKNFNGVYHKFVTILYIAKFYSNTTSFNQLINIFDNENILLYCDNYKCTSPVINSGNKYILYDINDQHINMNITIAEYIEKYKFISNVTQLNYNDSLALIRSVQYDNFELFKYLVINNSNISKYLHKLLTLSVDYKCELIFIYIIEHYYDLNNLDFDLLFLVCRSNNLKMISYLVDRKVFILVETLICSIIQCDLNIIFYLLSSYNNLDLNIFKNNEYYIIRHKELVIYFINNGFDINILLNEAILNKNWDIIKLLIYNGGDINICNNIILNTAIKNNNSNMIRFLIKYGATIYDINDTLKYACHKYNWKLIKLLINKGADIHIDNELPLISTVNQFYDDKNFDYNCIIKYLMHNGTDLNNINKNLLQKVYNCFDQINYQIII